MCLLLLAVSQIIFVRIDCAVCVLETTVVCCQMSETAEFMRVISSCSKRQTDKLHPPAYLLT